MRTRSTIALLSAITALAACGIPGRDNESDPTNIKAPTVHVLRLETFSCRQWIFPFIEGHDELRASTAFSAAERMAIDAYCDPVCGVLDPGGPEDPDYVFNRCQETRVLAGQNSLLETALPCTGIDDSQATPADDAPDGTASEPLPMGFVEEASPSADPASMDVAVWASVGGEGFPVSVVEFDLGSLPEDTLRVMPLAQVTTSENIFITEALRKRLPEDARFLTRSLVGLDIQRLDLTLRSRNRIELAETSCHLRLEFDPSLDVSQHPNGVSGEYGKHVAVGNLAMDRGALPHDPLEIATSYQRPDGSCVVDLLYRDRTTRLRSWGRDGHEPIDSRCDVSGGAPPFAFARLVDKPGDALIYPAPRNVLHPQWGAIDVLVGRAGFDLRSVTPLTLVWSTSASGAPAQIADVGDLDADGLSEVAIVADDRSFLKLCTSARTSFDRDAPVTIECATLPMPACAGEPVTRIAAVATQTWSVPVDYLAATVQTATGSCVQWWDAGTLAPVRTDAFAGRPDVVTMHWAPREYDADPSADGLQSADRAVLVVTGALDETNPFAISREIDPVTSFTRVNRVMDSGCAVIDDETLGIGQSAASILERECGTQTCRTRERRVLGIPNLAQAGVTGAGTLATFDGGACTAGAYRPDRLRFANLSPFGLGSSVAARLDPERARRRTRSSASPCAAPSVVAIGAPGGGGLSAAGHVVISYEHVGIDGSAECTVTMPQQ